jgi:hypothetical protein
LKPGASLSATASSWSRTAAASGWAQIVRSGRGLAALPGPLPAQEDRRDGALEALVGVADDQPHARQAARPEAAQEGCPERAVLAVADGQAEHLAVAVGPHAGGDHDRLGDDRRSLVGLDVGRVEEDIGEADVVERPLAGRP